MHYNRKILKNVIIINITYEIKGFVNYYSNYHGKVSVHYSYELCSTNC